MYYYTVKIAYYENLPLDFSEELMSITNCDGIDDRPGNFYLIPDTTEPKFGTLMMSWRCPMIMKVVKSRDITIGL